MNRLMNLPYEELIQDRCGVSKQMERLMESRNLHEFLDDLNAVKAAVEAWMDERGMTYGVFNEYFENRDQEEAK